MSASYIQTYDRVKGIDIYREKDVLKLQKWSSVGRLWLSKMVSLARYAPNRRKFGIQTGVWGDFEGDIMCKTNAQ